MIAVLLTFVALAVSGGLAYRSLRQIEACTLALGALDPHQWRAVTSEMDDATEELRSAIFDRTDR